MFCGAERICSTFRDVVWFAYEDYSRPYEP